MKNKRHIAILLALFMLLAGCGSGVRDVTTPPPGPSGEPVGTAGPTAAPDEAAVKDYTYAFNRYAPEEIVMTVDGVEITWREYFYRVISIVRMFESNFGSITDWDASSLVDETATIREFVENETLTNLRLEGGIRAHARDLGITLTAENEEELENGVTAELDQIQANGYDPEEILASFYLTRADYKNLRAVGYLYTNIFNEIYGERGEKCVDSEVVDYIEAQSLIYSKHIFLKTTVVDEESGGEVDLPEAEMAEKEALAKSLLAELDAAEDKDAKFNELMKEHSEDPGKETHPDGYVFGAADSIYPEYRETMEALLPGEYSGVVKSAYGYHIIMRMELALDTVLDTLASGQAVTVRYEASAANFDKLVDSWSKEAVIEYTEKFRDLSFEDIFNQ